jgi:hypothetical protein
MFKVSRYLFFIVMPLVLSGCAMSAGVKKADDSGGMPRWARDIKAVYPDAVWIAAVGQGATRQKAELAALDALAGIFHTDILGVTHAYEAYTQTITGANKKKSVSLDESLDFAQNVTATASVSGLIGVVTEAVQDKKGIWWANARMNRAECAAIYTKTVRENEKIITDLRASAAKQPGTLDAYANLRFAIIVAEVTDDIQSKLAVLDSGAAQRGVSYGNTDALRAEAMNAAHTVTIGIQVNGDESGRIANALAAFFTGYGLRTGPGGAYTLSAQHTIENVDRPNKQGYTYVRYVFQTVVKDGNGKDVFAWSETGLEGHISDKEARQRVLRALENAIQEGDFARRFTDYLDSLL